MTKFISKNLENFYDLTVKDPLFAAEGLDIENAKHALNKLREITEKLKILEENRFKRIFLILHPLSRILHPIEFLNNFLGCEKYRREFIETPTFPNAQKLIECYSKTQKSLTKNLIAYRKSCIDAQSKSKNKNPNSSFYNFNYRKVYFNEFIETIDLMLTNSKALEKEINTRTQILLRSVKRELSTKSSMVKIKSTRSHSQPKHLTKQTKNENKTEIIEWAELGRDFMFYVEKEFGKTSTNLIGPINYTLSQFNKGPKKHKFFVSIVNDNQGTRRLFHPILADDFHFIELNPETYRFYADIFTYEPLTKRGIKFWYQPATALYFTPDLTYYADLATIVDFKLRPNLNKIYLEKQRSSMLDLFIWDGYYHDLSYFHNISKRIKAGKEIGSWHYMLIGRSYPSLYYLTYNKSVWRIKNTPNFIGHASPKPNYYISLKDLPKTIKKTELKKIFYGGIIRAKDAYE